MNKDRSYLLIVTGLFTALSACTVPKTLINPDEQKTFVDGGADYYSAESADEEITANNNQWTLDAEGNRVYTLNSIERGSHTQYYVGDQRYWAANSRNPNDRIQQGFHNRFQSDYSHLISNNQAFWRNRHSYVPYLIGQRRPALTTDANPSDANQAAPSAPTPAPVATPQPRPRLTAPRRAPSSSRGPRSGPETSRSPSRGRQSSNENTRRTP